MINNIFGSLLIIAILILSCNESGQQQASKSNDTSSYPKGSFGYDLNFLKQHDDSVIVLSMDSNTARIIVSPKYQAKVFTSTADGDGGQSFGWVNYKAFTGAPDGHMNAYGGENRLWLGPEGGKYSLFFPPDSQMVFANWKTPAPFDTELWNVVNENDHSVTMQKAMQLTNYKGTQLDLSVERSVKILGNEEIAKRIGLALDTSVKAVAYQTVNTITNKGQNEWTEATGMPCLWLLDMFNPSPSTVIVVPFKSLSGKPFNQIATSDYFGQIPSDRLKHNDDILFFKADGKSRGKLGVVPGYAKPLAGSYDPEHKVLTIILFDVDSSAKYLNQEWNTTKPIFSGDAVNAYNDGPLGDGTQMGPFYEIESVSPAAFLKPGQSLSHKHAVFHFTGDENGLNTIAEKLLGVSLEDIQKEFQN
ncbi:MAG: DUF6786 family protein [Ginsengibacter sp.]